jgi:membrane fusion protein
VPDDTRISKENVSDIAKIFREDFVKKTGQVAPEPIALLGVPTWIICILMALILVGVFLFAFFAHYSRKETVTGEIVPVAGAFRVTTSQSGVAEEVLIHDGDYVEAGKKLFAVSTNSTLQNGENLKDAIRKQQVEQNDAQDRQMQARLKQIAEQSSELNAKRVTAIADLEKLEDNRLILEKRRALQISDNEAMTKLAQSGMISQVMQRQHQDSLLAIEQQIQELVRDRTRQLNQLAEIPPQLKRLAAEADQTRFEAKVAKAELTEKSLTSEAQLSHYLTAPISGRVAALQIRSGMPITPSETLAVIIPGKEPAEGQLEVELWAPSKAIGFVKPGNEVRLMYDAFPYQTFGVGHGTIYQVAGTPINAQELPMAADSREQLFRIRVKLSNNGSFLYAYGRRWPLVPGMKLSADIVLEKMTIFEMLLDPIRAISKRAL